ncbi:MAG: YdeI/OmpD-associated family protein [Ferruginibacter sp.]
MFIDEPEALAFFNTLPNGHKNYFGGWIRSAKTEETKTKRIAQAVNALSKGYRFNIMIRMLNADKKELEE